MKKLRRIFRQHPVIDIFSLGVGFFQGELRFFERELIVAFLGVGVSFFREIQFFRGAGGVQIFFVGIDTFLGLDMYF